MPRTRPFIDKKNAIKFHLVPRSQRDPLQASEDAPSHVLVSIDNDEAKSSDTKRHEEQRKYGVFYDDDYDYMQHLYDLDEVRPIENDIVIDDVTILGEVQDSDQETTPEPTLQLPSSVLPSTVETTVGLLNKAVPIRGPQPDWDPDIVAALDDDFDMDDPDNVLEDDFIAQANPNNDEEDDDSYTDCSDVDSMSGYQSDSEDENGERLYMNEETKSRFTNYSLSSSVMRRNDGLTLLDDRFEKLYEEYDDSEIGPLDHDDIEGCLTQDDPLMQQVIQQFETLKQKAQEEKKIDAPDEGGDIGKVGDPASKSDNESSESVENMVIERPDKQWDCESILSTYSNLYNHPRLIEGPKKDKIELTSRLQIPRDTLPDTGLTRKQIEKEIRESHKVDRVSTLRPKDELNEEKRSRKQAIKAERKERRIEKKSNKMAFKIEEERQKKVKINVMQNTQGIKMT